MWGAYNWYRLHAKHAKLGGSGSIPPGKFLKIRPSENEYESDLSSLSQYNMTFVLLYQQGIWSLN